MSCRTYIESDGHFVRFVETRRVEEGTVSVPRWRTVVDVTLPVSRAARDYVAGRKA